MDKQQPTNSVEFVLSILTAILLVVLMVDTFLRPPSVTIEGQQRPTTLIHGASLPCPPTPAPCEFYAYQPTTNSCALVQYPPGHACVSVCGEEGVCIGATCTPTNGSWSACDSEDDCSPRLTLDLPNNTHLSVACVEGRCQWRVLQPFVDRALHLHAGSCTQLVPLAQRSCVRTTAHLVPLNLSRHKDTDFQYRICVFQ
jgi:hypothetical protein